MNKVSLEGKLRTQTLREQKRGDYRVWGAMLEAYCKLKEPLMIA